MTVTRLQSKINSSDATSVTSLTTIFDATPSEGSLLIAVILNQYNPGTRTLPAGWDTLHTLAPQPHAWIGWKIAGPSEATSVTTSWTSSRRSVMVLLEYVGIDSTDAIDVTATANSGGVNTTSQTSGTTAALDLSGQLGLAIFGVENMSSYSNRSYTNSYSEVLAATGGAGSVPLITAAEKNGLVAASTTNTTCSTTAGGNPIWGVILTIHAGPLLAGAASTVDRTSTTVSLSATDAAGGVDPYTYQWHRSTSSGFTPSGGNAISGATSLTLLDTGLSDATTYYYKLAYTDNIATTVYSDELVVTTSGYPLVIITDHDEATSGIVSGMGPLCVTFHATASLRGTGLEIGDWKDTLVEWDFGDPTGRYNVLRGFSAAHIWDIEPASPTNFTVTCTITNSNGLSASAIRTVRVLPNTRTVFYIDPDTGTGAPTSPENNPAAPYDTIANAWSAKAANNTEFRLTANKSHSYTASVGSGSYANIMVRSTIKGTKFTAMMTSNAIHGGNAIALRDAHFAVGGAGSTRRMLDPRFGGRGCWVLDCSSVDPDVIPGTLSVSSGATTFVGVSCDDIRGGILYDGALGTMLGMTMRHSGGERPLRGTGDHALIHDCVTRYAGTAGKVAFDRSGGQFVWIYGNQFYNDDLTNASSCPASLGHPSSSPDPGPQVIVFEKNLCEQAVGAAGKLCLNMSPTNQVVEDCVIRNNIFNRGSLQLGTGSPTFPLRRLRLYHNTVIYPDSPHVVLFQEYNDVLLRNNLFLQYASTGNGPQVLTIANTNTSSPEITDNIWPITVSNQDARVDGAGTRISWDTFNALGLGTGNLAKNITVDELFRPDDVEDIDILKPIPQKMVLFNEDYYGNQREGSLWITGAVGVIPQIHNNDESVESSQASLEFTAIVAYANNTTDGYTIIFSKDGALTEFGKDINTLLDRISRDTSIKSFLNIIGLTSSSGSQLSDVSAIAWRFQAKSNSKDSIAMWSEAGNDNFHYLSNQDISFWEFLSTDSNASILLTKLL